MQRIHIAIRGAVQGVGFRPFVYRLATEMQLCGWVLNSAQGVFIEVLVRPLLRRLHDLVERHGFLLGRREPRAQADDQQETGLLHGRRAVQDNLKRICQG